MAQSRRALVAAHLIAALTSAPLLSVSCGQAPPTPRSKLGQPPRAAADGLVLGANNNETPVDDQLDQSLQIVVQPDKERPVVVELAPGWYLEQNGIAFEPGDRISAEGSPSAHGVLVATKVRRGSSTLLLRNAYGEPLWESPDASPP